MPLGELKIVFLGHPGVKFQDTELGVVPNFMFLAYTHVLGVRNQIPFDEFKVELPTRYGIHFLLRHFGFSTPPRSCQKTGCSIPR